MSEIHKALLVAVNSRGEFLIQDREGYKPPRFGFFGGGIEEGESEIEAVIRETKEELDIDVTEENLSYLGTISGNWDEVVVVRHLFLYRTEQQNFTVLEGAGAMWLSREEMQQKMNMGERLDELFALVDRHDSIFRESFRGELISYTETMAVTEGVECDVYSFVGDAGKDLGIVRVKAGYKTPLQKVISGDKTVEGYSKGTGVLRVDDNEYHFPNDMQNDVQVEVGQTMQWEAIEDLEFYEICFPPYADGRFENLDMD